MDENVKNNLLTGLESISSGAAGCGLDFSSLEDKNEDIENVSSFLGITKTQAIFFSVLAELSLMSPVSIDNVAGHLGCSILKLLTLMHEIECLEARAYIKRAKRKSKRNIRSVYKDTMFHVPHNIFEALRTGDRSKLRTELKCELPDFLNRIADLVNDRGEESISTHQLQSDAKTIIEGNKHHRFVKYIDSNLIDTISKITVFAVSYVRLKGQMNVSVNSFATALFDDLGEQLEYTQQILAGSHELIAKGMLKVETSDFMDEKVIVLNSAASKTLGEAFPGLFAEEPERNDVLSWQDIRAKKLFFPASTMEHLHPLELLIGKKRFKAYKKELSNNNLTPGITAIFHGAPGTGKTEAVYQLARKTGRNIMIVDLSQTKSKWFGESEKVVKKIFDDYARLLAGSKVEPILFINEGDGLFSRRVDLANRGTASDQAINTMQNIMLQELERFEGILITTTNLTGNLDRAFERRLTFKISFPVPDVYARKHIWKTKVPELTPAQASVLAEKYKITGGEIDVQVRHLLMKKVLDKNIDIFGTLSESCSSSAGLEKTKKVGFLSTPQIGCGTSS